MKSSDIPQSRWWERLWKYKSRDNNQHDFFMVWADSKISGRQKSVFWDK